MLFNSKTSTVLLFVRIVIIFDRSHCCNLINMAFSLKKSVYQSRKVLLFTSQKYFPTIHCRRYSCFLLFFIRSVRSLSKMLVSGGLLSCNLINQWPIASKTRIQEIIDSCIHQINIQSKIMNTTSTIPSRYISLKTLANRTNVILGTTRCYHFQWRAVNLSKRIRHTEKKETNEGFKRCEETAKWRCGESGEILYSSDKRGKTSSCVFADNSFSYASPVASSDWTVFTSVLVQYWFHVVVSKIFTHICLSFTSLKNSLPFLIQ